MLLTVHFPAKVEGVLPRARVSTESWVWRRAEIELAEVSAEAVTPVLTWLKIWRRMTCRADGQVDYSDNEPELRTFFGVDGYAGLFEELPADKLSIAKRDRKLHRELLGIASEISCHDNQASDEAPAFTHVIKDHTSDYERIIARAAAKRVVVDGRVLVPAHEPCISVTLSDHRQTLQNWAVTSHKGTYYPTTDVLFRADQMDAAVELMRSRGGGEDADSFAERNQISVHLPDRLTFDPHRARVVGLAGQLVESQRGKLDALPTEQIQAWVRLRDFLDEHANTAPIPEVLEVTDHAFDVLQHSVLIGGGTKRLIRALLTEPRDIADDDVDALIGGPGL